MNYRGLNIFSTNLGLLLLLVMVIRSSPLISQNIEEKQVGQKEKLVNVSGSMQFWMRYASLNPGSTFDDRPQDKVLDLSIRRYRLKFSGKANEQIRYSFELGNNDLSFHNAESSTPKLLEAYVDYQIHESLAFGIGKHAWTGLSRYAAPSSTQALAYDLDFVAAPYVNVYDDVLRRMGIYVRGTLAAFDYRIVVAKPKFSQAVSGGAISDDARFSDRNPEFQLSTYVKYQFLEKEAQNSPFSPGTYLGKKDLLNLGLGMMHQPNTSWYLDAEDSVYHNATSLAADLFYEKSLKNNKALTFYLAYIYHDLGRNFMRYMGANNPSTGIAPSDFVNGKGNNAPVLGTGRILYLQLGYLRAADTFNRNQIQPYVSLEYGRFEALHDPVIIYNTGVNYFLEGHKSKISFGFQSRPVFKMDEHLVKDNMRKYMLVLQYQILFGG